MVVDTATGMNVQGIVSSLRDLAKQPNNRSAIVRDKASLGGLILFLDSSEVEVVRTALEALRYLTEEQEGRTAIQGEAGLLDNLQKLQNRLPDPEILNEAQELEKRLSPQKASSNNEKREKLLAQAKANAAVGSSAGSQTGKRQQQSFFTGASVKKARTVTLYVEGMNTSELRGIVEERLLTVRGVISFTFDISRERVVVRVTHAVKVEQICKAVNDKQDVHAQQVVKNDNGEEVLVDPCPVVADAEADDGYIDEDDYDGVAANDSSWGTGWLVRKGDKNKKDDGGGVIGAAASWLTKKFYW
eukprot:Clim_evm38s99 gene=Clim_evmTU38s99